MGEVKLPISERLREAEGKIVWVSGYTEDGPLLDEGADVIDALYLALRDLFVCYMAGAAPRETWDKARAAIAKAEASPNA